METQDHGLIKKFTILLGLISVFGLISIFSSSYMYANEVYGTPYYFVIRQSIFFLAGITLCFAISRTQFSFWYKRFIWIHFLITLMIICTFIPGIGVEVKGAYRWLHFGYFRVQPGELIKYSTLLYCLNFFGRYQSMDPKQKAINWSILILPLIFLISQPDFGTVTICFFVILLTLFFTWVSKKLFWGTLGVCLVSCVILILSAPYRVKRLMSYLDPWKDPQNSGFQIIQSFLAFSNGSFWGKGIGNSHEKLFYLPEAHNDFILSVIGEEFGFFGIAVIVIAFASLIFLGLKMAMQNEKKIISIFCASVILIIGMQCFLNMGVVLGILPTKGMNLPFISYGGSSLVANFLALGLMFSAYRSRNDFVPSEESGRREPMSHRQDLKSRMNYYSNSNFSSKLPK